MNGESSETWTASLTDPPHSQKASCPTLLASSFSHCTQPDGIFVKAREHAMSHAHPVLISTFTTSATPALYTSEQASGNADAEETTQTGHNNTLLCPRSRQHAAIHKPHRHRDTPQFHAGREPGRVPRPMEITHSSWVARTT